MLHALAAAGSDTIGGMAARARDRQHDAFAAEVRRLMLALPPTAAAMSVREAYLYGWAGWLFGTISATRSTVPLDP
jgi:hypothetical protein